MKKLDFHWMDNDDWYYQLENGAFVVREDAPPEAQESYKHYLEQKERGRKNGTL